MTEAPKELLEVIWLRPGNSPNWRSRGAVIEEAVTSGLAPGIKRDNLDGRVVDLRQGGNRQLLVGDNAYQQQPRHQQRSRDRPKNKWPGNTHDCESDVAGNLCVPRLSALLLRRLRSDLAAGLQLLLSVGDDAFAGL